MVTFAPLYLIGWPLVTASNTTCSAVLPPVELLLLSYESAKATTSGGGGVGVGAPFCGVNTGAPPSAGHWLGLGLIDGEDAVDVPGAGAPFCGVNTGAPPPAGH